MLARSKNAIDAAVKDCSRKCAGPVIDYLHFTNLRGRYMKVTPEIDPDRKRKILQYCRFHPKATVGDIAGSLRKSEAQTARYLETLQADGSLTRRWVVNMDELGWCHKYRIDVRINPRELNESRDLPPSGSEWGTTNPQEMLAHYLMDQFMEAEDAKAAPDAIIEDVTILLGDPADLCILVRVKDPRALYTFITEKVRGTLGVENTSTCTEAWSAASARERRKDMNGDSGNSSDTHPRIEK
ncbi:hypothetical protein [Paludibaculum fermentans]|uniref:hypothetical protein n=1 Tax=Paludibaculum fermentans TaxID=1473598 RepID=UPI003EBFCFEA